MFFMMINKKGKSKAMLAESINHAKAMEVRVQQEAQCCIDMGKAEATKVTCLCFVLFP
jgi:hypothetical protein